MKIPGAFLALLTVLPAAVLAAGLEPDFVATRLQGSAALVFSHDGTRLAAGCGDHTTRVWDTSSWKEVLHATTTGQDAHGLDFSPDGTLLIAGYTGPEIIIWDTKSGKPMSSFRGHSEWAVGIVRFSPDGNYFATDGGDNKVKVWKTKGLFATRFSALTISGKAEFVSLGGWVDHGHSLAIADDHKIKIINVKSGRTQRTLDGFAAISIVVSPDGGYLAALDEPSISLGPPPARITIFRTEDWKQVGEFRSQGVERISFSRNGKFLALGHSNGSISLREGGSWAECLAIQAHSNAVISLAFSPDGKRLASGSRDGTVKVWPISR